MIWGWYHVRVGDLWAFAQAGGTGSPRRAAEALVLEGGQRRREPVLWLLVKFFTLSVRVLGSTRPLHPASERTVCGGHQGVDVCGPCHAYQQAYISV